MPKRHCEVLTTCKKMKFFNLLREEENMAEVAKIYIKNEYLSKKLFSVVTSYGC
jgi:hypothetical protein